MSHRQKSRHSPRHHTHAVKPRLQLIPLPPYVDPNAPKPEDKAEATPVVSQTQAQVEETVAV